MAEVNLELRAQISEMERWWADPTAYLEPTKALMSTLEYLDIVAFEFDTDAFLAGLRRDVDSFVLT